MLQAKLCCLYRTKTKGKTINQEKVNYFAEILFYIDYKPFILY